MDAAGYQRIADIVRRRLRECGGCHDFDHTLRVVRNAEELLRHYPEAEADIVRLGALLHDVARPEEYANPGTVCHAQLGGPIARRLLLEQGFAPELAEAVANCVARHRYRDDNAPESLEEKLVYDADKLDSLGATGIGRAFLFAGRCNAKLHNRAEVAVNEPAYGPEDTAFREYLVKLRHLPEKMQTTAGRRVAEERESFMRRFFEQLHEEVFSEKLDIG